MGGTWWKKAVWVNINATMHSNRSVRFFTSKSLRTMTLSSEVLTYSVLATLNCSPSCMDDQIADGQERISKTTCMNFGESLGVLENRLNACEYFCFMESHRFVESWIAKGNV